MKISDFHQEIPDDTRSSGFLQVYILAAYFLLVGILAVFAFSPLSGEMGYILARMTPHLMYIPLVLTALWYPKQKIAHVFIFLVIFAFLCTGFILRGWSLDLMFTIFTSFIYMWVYFAILVIPRIRYAGEKRTADKPIKNIDGLLREENQKADLISTAPVSKTVLHQPVLEVSVPGAEKTAEIPPERIIALIESLRVNEKDIIAKTCLSIEAVGIQAEPYLIDGLLSDSLPIRENSAKILGIFQSVDAVGSLIETMNDPSKKVHNACVQALAKIGMPATDSLLDSLFDKRWKIRAGSLAALRIIGYREGINQIAALLADENHYVRKEAAKSLGRIGDRSVSDLLCDVLFDEFRGVRLAAVTALGRIGDDKAVIDLLSLYTNEKDPEVRERVIESLSMIGTPAAYEAIKVAGKDPNAEIRKIVEDYLNE
ncbi:HEAT repeat domain-containing protein [Methanoplanus sp. FWC-SCC4]|uniref:HEAT repeat domain-containing protein n=1 Tax=Methanochimaera problematica TaxID=2609417 RepID=A0AA97I4Y6_9EURY|nr:HEAT repeat domain-containing protein [Methanoplanus sp. FWC-SCC4]WOF16876.1 HEAT repeat domain-containing protein [Methanoplanus sp. FWC-SCC4]